MDRRKFFDKQLVEDTDLNAAVTNTYNAIGNLMSDIGIFGIISGGVVTEQGAPSMSVDMTGPFIGYDQDGERIYRSTSDVIDCSVDYLANATVPTVPGEGRWISIHGRFDYTLQDSKVIDGSTEYLTWKESYEWRVVSGVAAATPGHTQPAKPADAILICDIELVFGQTSILNADIDTSRRDDFVFAAASAISVSAGAWTNIDSAVLNVQAALDSVDSELLSRDGSGDIDADLTFAAGTDVGTAAKPATDVRGTNIISHKGALAGAFVHSAALTVARRRHPIVHAGKEAGWSFVPYTGAVGSRNIYSHLYNTGGGSKDTDIPIDLPDGVSVTDFFVTWHEATTNQSIIAFVRKDNQGAISTRGAIIKTTANAWDDGDRKTLSSPEVIDLQTYEYYIRITGPSSANDLNVVSLAFTYDVTDIGAAAT